MRQRISMVFASLVVASCFNFRSGPDDGCGPPPPTPCTSDYECPANSVCNDYCAFAKECTSSNDCAEGETCERRNTAENPFDTPPPGKTVCICKAPPCSGSSVSSTSSTDMTSVGMGGSDASAHGGSDGSGGIGGIGGAVGGAAGEGGGP